MSKQITIPSDRGNPVIVVVNGRKYIYAAGSTETVPDEVAALLESNAEIKAVPDRDVFAPLSAAGREDGSDVIPVYADKNGQLWVRKSDIGSGLPAVTADDNGDVLTVVSGAWGKAAPSGGGNGIWWVDLIYDTEADDGTYTCNKTYAEILEAINAGENVVARSGYDDEHWDVFVERVYYLGGFTDGEDMKEIYFRATPDLGFESISFYHATISPDGVTVSMYTYPSGGGY